MTYQELIAKGLKNKKLNLRQAARLIFEQSGIKTDYSYLSKLKSGAKPPASDKLNDALAQVLGIDPLVLKEAAYREKIPEDVLRKIKESSA